jgi:uncharacterized membrane protein YhaH (DUF805 family)
MSVTELLFSFHGRIGIGKFWLGVLLHLLIVIGGFAVVFTLAAIVDPTLFDEQHKHDPHPAAGLILLFGMLVIGVLGIVINFAIMVKRCHDRGQSGWMSLISLIPFFIGFLWWLINLGILEGDHGANEYGPDPQNREPRGPYPGYASAARPLPAGGSFDAEQIRKLKMLLDDGLITRDEFERKKLQLMGL